MPRHPYHPEGDLSPDELAERALTLLRPPDEGEAGLEEPPRDQDIEPPPHNEKPEV